MIENIDKISVGEVGIIKSDIVAGSEKVVSELGLRITEILNTGEYSISSPGIIKGELVGENLVTFL